MKPKIYIQEIILIDFESHKNTVLKDFSPGFNCISGVSDLGKTSCIRAIKLCAYNSFSQEMVRLGSDFCDVTVKTNIGSVNVKRGKNTNLWTITRNDGSKPMVFDKVGKNAVSEACSVLGMKIITLGDIEIPVNIMEQLESHFLISSVGGEKTSGSSRAEIIDEICGLNGVEELVKTISLDQYRLTREITQAEERIDEISKSLNSELQIQHDADVLAQLELLSQNISVLEQNTGFIQDLKQSHEDIALLRLNLLNQIRALPDVNSITEILKMARLNTNVLSSANQTLGEYNLYLKKQQENKTLSESLPETESIFPLITSCREILGKITVVKNLIKTYEDTKIQKNKISLDLSMFKNSDISLPQQKAREGLALISTCEGINLDYQKIKDKIESVKTDIEKQTQLLAITENEISEMYKNMDVCPVTKKPITDVCSLYNMHMEIKNGCSRND